jgi:hypothetical protein
LSRTARFRRLDPGRGEGKAKIREQIATKKLEKERHQDTSHPPCPKWNKRDMKAYA